MAEGKLRVVIKVGTQVISQPDGSLNQLFLDKLVDQVEKLTQSGFSISIVSSGAVGLGRKSLGLENATKLELKQASAAIGQADLIQSYKMAFAEKNKKVAQILVSSNDFSSRERYLNLKRTVDELIKHSVIPIFNENDPISIAELTSGDRQGSFGDNDRLSAIVAGKLGAQLLVIFTDVDGVYEENPRENSNAKLISSISSIDELNQLKLDGESENGRGGMKSKTDAALMASMSGVLSLINSGEKVEALAQTLIDLKGDKKPKYGTLVMPSGELKGRKLWIGVSSGFTGVLVVNEGAREALVKKRSSLLPVGIVEVKGRFGVGDIVSVQTQDHYEIARGQVNFSSQETLQVLGVHSRELRLKFGDTRAEEIIHRDKLVVYADHALESSNE